MSFDALAHPPTLRHDPIALRPLTAEDAPALFACTPPDSFRYFLSNPVEWTPKAFAEWLHAHATSPKVRAFLVVDARSGAPLGSSAYLDIDAPNRSLEIGATWYVQAARGTAVNSTCKLLLLEHAFATVGCERVTLKCDSRNAHSRAAIAAIGATFEGILRKHRVMQDGYVRDTAYFSVIREEWPRVRQHLLARISARGGAMS